MSDRERAQEYHNERSKRSRIADESFRAVKVTDNYEEWRSAPSEMDFEGVDTIPPARKQQRAERALKTAQNKGLVNEFYEPESTRGLPGTSTYGEAGSFQGATKELGVKSSLDEDKRQETLAHEVGHAVDHGGFAISAAGMKDSGLANRLDEDLRPVIASERITEEVSGPVSEPNTPAEEMREVSQETRGEFDFGEDQYRDSPEELFADFMGSAIIRPRNTKAKTKESRKSLAKTLDDPPEELEPTKDFLDDQLPGFLD